MTTIIRRKRASRSLIGPYRRHELLTGRIQYPVQGYMGYGDGVGTDLTAFISNEMRRDWAANRDELLKFWKSGEYTSYRVFPDSLPWLCSVHSGADTPPMGGGASRTRQHTSRCCRSAKQIANSDGGGARSRQLPVRRRLGKPRLRDWACCLSFYSEDWHRSANFGEKTQIIGAQ